MSANTCISIREDNITEYKKLRIALKKRGESAGDYLVRKWMEEKSTTYLDETD